MCKLEDPQLVGQLAAIIAEHGWFAWAPLQAVESILRKHAAAVPLEVLKQVGKLSDCFETRTVSVMRYGFDAMTDNPTGLEYQEKEQRSYELNCSTARELAKTAIARRREKK